MMESGLVLQLAPLWRSAIYQSRHALDTFWNYQGHLGVTRAFDKRMQSRGLSGRAELAEAMNMLCL